LPRRPRFSYSKKAQEIWGDENDDTDGKNEKMILALLDEAVASGARLERACEEIGLTVRSVQWWRAAPRTTFAGAQRPLRAKS